MATFTDLAGRQHSVQITLLTRRRVKEQLGIDFAACAVEPAKLHELLTTVSDSEQLFRLIAAIVGVPEESLLESADQDTEEAAGVALLQALADFFQNSNPLKAALRDLLTRVQTARTTAAVAIAAAFNKEIQGLDIASVLSGSTTVTSGWNGSLSLVGSSPEST